MGTPYEQLVEAAGGFKVQPEKLVSGGPMMGFAIFGLDVPTTKTTSSLLCLGKDEVAEFEPLACISCGRCVEACPEKLIPSRLAKFSEHGLLSYNSYYHLPSRNSELSLSLSFNYTQDLNLFLLIYNQKILSKNPLPCIIKPLS